MKFKKVAVFLVIIVLVVGMYIFIHSKPERLIRSNLFFNGHFIYAFTTDVFTTDYDKQYGQRYSCKDPAIGPDYYAFIKKNGLWYINWDGTGGA